ncbi:MAG: Phenylalanine--tRNA ligase beta subunit [candidate division WS6 bacterium OLB20]|uniref:Phenylalanine--tRNA ligase beta subunit n=1 Tax=candidate division WS6 bacterium OLB20 TaxID=1617426 RepID=A0A136LY54_9BACT|nr:MAG: Phenylalanine--tRNA ligase beta subunit [candidate division WS6 bacterium OLB20]
MLLSFSWLQTYLPDLHTFDHKTIAEALTGSLAEVEGITGVRKGLKNISAGEVISVEPHPTHKKLSVCAVKLANSERTIICGAPNVAAGMIVAVCLPGGSVLNPKQPLGSQDVFMIEQRQIGEVTSEGMICSAKELGLSESHDGILELEPEMIPGTDLVPMLQDTVFEIENKSISHRPDCFSHRGIARELSAILNTEFQETPSDVSLIPTANLPLAVDRKVSAELCSRFNAVTVTEVTVKQSPLWLVARLAAVGIRSVNNVVDITNFVMMDIGQPLHAFDYDKLADAELTVRNAKQGESIKALDGSTYKLSKDMVIIADGAGKPESIAGIMGGARTEITEKTTNIVLEAANWEMYNIRRSSRELGLRTEASTRFEKGQDPNLTMDGLKDALALVQDVAGGELACEPVDIYPEPVTEHTVELPVPMVKRFLGIDLKTDAVIELLEALGLEHLEEESSAENIEKDSQIFRIPTWRGDLKIAQDLLEEVARMYGYDAIVPTLPEGSLEPVARNPVSVVNRIIRDSLTGSGLDELITYSFTGEDDYKRIRLDHTKALALSNPISPDLRLLRTTLLTNLTAKLLRMPSDTAYSAFLNSDALSRRRPMIAVSICSRERWPVCWPMSRLPSCFFDAKGVIEVLLKDLHIDTDAVRFVPLAEEPGAGASAAFHPVRTAVVYIGEERLGIVGELHPEILLTEDYDGRISAFELDADLLLKHYNEYATYTRISEFQAVSRDLSFWVARSVLYTDFVGAIHALNNPLVKNVELVDVFMPAGEEKRKGITVSITLQSMERTLSEEDINSAVETVSHALKSAVKAELRS